jgi:hypothetical protein
MSHGKSSRRLGGATSFGTPAPLAQKERAAVTPTRHAGYALSQRNEVEEGRP